ncbi:MAG: hypothetical protein F4179_06360 [Gammaproteobacteria bacterium]|nr:hypothetical protein [Gammaproteobacteria bacterium]MYF61282.1 hypothetical protein [Gammaproteobacteria bacterium]
MPAVSAPGIFPAMSRPDPPRSHLWPRTRDGRIAVIAFVLLFMLAMPPVTHSVLNRIEPTFLGLPFLYVALFAVYSVLIGVLIWAYRRGL